MRYKFELKAATIVGFGPATIAYYRSGELGKCKLCYIS